MQFPPSLQAEKEGWLDGGLCGELAAAPAPASSAGDASAHSVQVGTVPLHVALCCDFST